MDIALTTFGQTFTVSTTAFVAGLSGLAGRLRNAGGSRVYYQFDAVSVKTSEDTVSGHGWLDADDAVAIPATATLVALKTAGGAANVVFEKNATKSATAAIVAAVLSAIGLSTIGGALLVATLAGNNTFTGTNVFTSNANVFYGSGAHLSGVAPEGTAVKSTGETSSSKVLTTNGSGGADWQTASGGASVPTGTVVDYAAITPPTGWVVANSSAIGDASSGATGRANGDTLALFTLFFDNYTDADGESAGGLDLRTAEGNLASRSSYANAAAAFAAHCRIATPDLRGRIVAGYDASAATGRMTTASVSAGTFGNMGGEQTHTLITSEMPAHTHSIAICTGTNSYASGTDASAKMDTGSTTSESTGGDGAHNNVQPTYILQKIIKL